MSQVFGALVPSQLPPKVTCKVTLARNGGDVRVIELAVAAARKYPDAEEQSLWPAESSHPSLTPRRCRLASPKRETRPFRMCLSCPVPVRSRCGCRTVKRVKGAWLGNTAAMMHYRRIVNAGGIQKWYGHDHEDKGHQTLPDWRGNASAPSASVASFQNSALDGFPPFLSLRRRENCDL